LLLPELKERHPNWEGLEGNPDWKSGSKAYNQFHSTLKNHLYKEGKWIHTNLPSRKQEKAKETPDHDDSEDQPEAPIQEKSNKMITRKEGKRPAPENDTYYQETIPAMNAKRQKVGKQDRVDKLPAKSVGYQIVETKPVTHLTQEEAFKELHLTNGNLMIQIQQVHQLRERREALMAIIRPTITDPMDALK
jgi:hypothetical protein